MDKLKKWSEVIWIISLNIMMVLFFILLINTKEDFTKYKQDTTEQIEFLKQQCELLINITDTVLTEMSIMCDEQIVIVDAIDGVRINLQQQIDYNSMMSDEWGEDIFWLNKEMWKLKD